MELVVNGIPSMQNLLDAWANSYYRGHAQLDDHFPRDITGSCELVDRNSDEFYLFPEARIRKRRQDTYTDVTGLDLAFDRDFI